MSYVVERLVRPEHLNGANTIFGGILLAWVDEAAAIAAMKKLWSPHIVTVAMSDVQFKRPVRSGSLVRIHVKVAGVGNTSVTFRVCVDSFGSRDPVMIIERIVFVLLDKNGKPTPHGLPPYREAKKKNKQ
ncbi:MAG: hypothetical protein A2942_04720 [Candidatus Lloydbacteria bacterium RIFCSPLOWO2_01_FULL_50_20]|uniref:HotDog ACOT-type domain-containing protein n=1 Tax=Candidatus Lloydbacteria bacterium RIFCSPLOWO2_01_FULL_50_20 TaxID=1798665 RepID=A0A1G2DJ30_9BACT|nr:MAG: hypothetical protein A3C13_03580 [Candidatus Lloydbacteria bacterium RIFCSPHIGHO2_02_FULL_50_11]OGZ13619.1 MAG: hypothetical protein A2942_04720 [Candidatus Lloydbacteria bacterium RIFCSPLOWO2_01_FULL_50_20]